MNTTTLRSINLSTAKRMLGAAPRRATQLSWFTVAMLATAVALLANTASAQNSVWIGGTSTWYDPAGWQGGVPNSTRNAFINNGGVVRHLLSISAEARSLTLGSNAGESGTVQVTATVPLTITNDLIVGNGGTGTLTISGVGDVTSFNGFLGVLPNSTGTATISGAGSSWNQGFFLEVGVAGVGTMRIQDGATVFTLAGPTIGVHAGGVGDVTVTGSGSMWRSRGKFLSVGGLGTGSLTISDSGVVDIEDFNGPGEVSINAVSTLNIGAGGLAGTLDAAGSPTDPGLLINNGALNFNHTDAVTQPTAISGTGTITKTGEGATTLPNASAFTGSFVASGGQMILQGSLNASLLAATPGGTLRFDGSTVNLSGTSAIRASGGDVEYVEATVNGGILRGDLPGTGTHTIVSSGLDDTIFNGVTIQNSAYVVQDGYAIFTNVTNGGRLTSNEFLFFDGGVNATSGHMIVNQLVSTRDFTNNGQITVNAGGNLRHMPGNLASGGGSRTTVNPGGEINLLLGSELDLNGALLVNDGSINGTVNVNFGSLATGSGSYGLVNVNRGGVFEPGNSPGIVTAQSLQFANTSIIGAPVLAIEIGGTTPGSEHDQVNVTDSLSLGGTLAVSLIDDFMPALGDEFQIIDVGGTLTGAFIGLTEDALVGTFGGTDLYITYAGGDGNDVVLYTEISSAVDGDFDNDGDVDGRDFLLWQRGGSPTPFSSGDLAAWQANNGFPPLTASSSAVPEPTSMILVFAAIWGVAVSRRWPQ